jgi:hypothetical protein
MFGWQYNEKILKDYMHNHSKDFGRLCCEIMFDFPVMYKEFIRGFDEELARRTRGNDSPPSDKDGVSGG